MKTIYGIKGLRIKKPTVATIGIFDGIHRGHQFILERLKSRARAVKALTCVVTFDPHPAKVLRPGKTPPMLISTKHKLALLAAEGLDLTVLVNFTREFSDIKAADFVKQVLVGRVNVKELLVGERFLFGKGRSGDIGLLRRLGRKFGFRVRSIAPVRAGKDIVSSTLIRKLILTGNLARAGRLMGRYVTIAGTVTKGARRGRLLGFPTANLDLHHEAIPPSGVYIVKARLGKRVYRGILNIGFRPTFRGGGKEPTAEVHIFGLNKSIYGKDIEVVFFKKIRQERRFRDKEHLLSRIRKDVNIAKKYFRERRI